MTLIGPLGLTFGLNFMSFELHKIFKVFIAQYTLDEDLFTWDITHVSTDVVPLYLYHQKWIN